MDFEPAQKSKKIYLNIMEDMDAVLDVIKNRAWDKLEQPV